MLIFKYLPEYDKYHFFIIEKEYKKYCIYGIILKNFHDEDCKILLHDDNIQEKFLIKRISFSEVTPSYLQELESASQSILYRERDNEKISLEIRINILNLDYLKLLTEKLNSIISIYSTGHMPSLATAKEVCINISLITEIFVIFSLTTEMKVRYDINNDIAKRILMLNNEIAVSLYKFYIKKENYLKNELMTLQHVLSETPSSLKLLGEITQ